jgi:hypothetical protein
MNAALGRPTKKRENNPMHSSHVADKAAKWLKRRAADFTKSVDPSGKTGA